MAHIDRVITETVRVFHIGRKTFKAIRTDYYPATPDDHRYVTVRALEWDYSNSEGWDWRIRHKWGGRTK